MSSDVPKVHQEQYRGWLLKWTNYIKGYQKRWFVLSNGLLSYYRTQEEMAHTCRGTVNLASAVIDTVDSTNFLITNGPSQIYHLRALNKVDRQRWVTALELAKIDAIKKLDSDESYGQNESADEAEGTAGTGASTVVKDLLAALQEKLKELNKAYDLVVKNIHQVSKVATDLESDSGNPKGEGAASTPKPKEKLALLKLTSGAMVKAAEEFISQAHDIERRWSRALAHEHSLRLQLQENMEALANQMHGLEDEARLSIHPVEHGTTSSSTIPELGPDTSTTRDEPDGKKSAIPEGKSESESDDDDAFFDAPEVSAEELKKFTHDSTSMASASGEDVREQHPLITSDHRMTVPTGPPPSFFENLSGPTLAARRTAIPPKPNHRLNLWSIVKNCVGKDLTKIPMPVNFSEPISMLQRMTEDLLYSDLLSRAAECSSTLEEAGYVTAFFCSFYASTATRIGKPFNPLLYETYECDRRAEQGWRVIFEQVSHHPPMFAMHTEHKEWTFWQEFTISSEFRGQYAVCYPIGGSHLVMHRTQSHYTSNKATITVHSIIVGKMWLDQSGKLTITNHATGEESHVDFHAYRYFSSEQQRKMSGSVYDSSGTPRYLIGGHWDENFTVAKIVSGKGKNVVTDSPRVLWRADPPSPDSELMYGFSAFTCSLNEPEPGVAPTDCRFRPDIRVMEQQDFDAANAEKVKLEEKQRARRRKREALAAKAAEAAAAGNMEEAERLKKESTISPVWFSKEYDHLTNSMRHAYKGGYWEAKAKGNWNQLNLPDIY